ncbi:amino acid ABC transporter substrate-binding protein [Halocatena salina]|uniref:Amino acid ABC transporter substrate-binding protein n=1 Tax=Halocatena salina TaxID=2934340 RepID=A0A8U0A9P6_9EURY|nr:amino acid ABC transporter substrate-binding protein [Halocatena salina]UPM45188.1 amino acid ABC transporter substrate-binding protein [Halocatena salina]
MIPDCVTVGLPVSQSGQFSHQGKQTLAGVKRWIRWANHRGGIRLDDDLQLPLKLVHHDDESDPVATKCLTRRLIRDDDVDILLGPYSSRLTRAVAPVAETHEIVLWNHSGATNALYDERSQWLVSVLTPASRYFHGILDLIKREDQSASQVTVCWSNSGSFGRTVAAGAIAHARTVGFTVGTTHRWDPPLDDVTSIVDSIQNETPDLVLAAGSFKDDVRFVRAVETGGCRVKAIGVVAAGISAFGEQLDETANGVFGPSQWELVLGESPDYGPSPADVVELFEDASVETVEYPAMQAFATGLIVERCLTTGAAFDATTGTIDQRRLRTTAEKSDFTTFYGRFRIDAETGKQIGHTPVVVQWQGNEKHVVWPEQRQHVEPRYPIHPDR